MIRVLVADDHAVVREGIKRIIADTGDMVVSDEAADGPELLSKVAEGKPDVVLMDLSMPGASGLELLEDVCRREPRVRVLVLTMHAEDQYAVRSLMAGAAGFLQKSNPPDELVAAIRTVAAGRRYITPEVAESLAAHVDTVSEKPRHETLSNREYQVMCLLASGKTVSEIAEELSVSVKTISTYRSRILEKLDVQHTSEIIRYAIKHGLVD